MSNFAFKRASLFDEQVRKLPASVYEKLGKCLEFLGINPRHPSLRTHKVQGKVGIYGGSIFEAYVDIKYRLTWEYAEQGYILLRNVDNHDACLSNP